MSDNPLISIITVVYNGVKTLEQTILSVINQSYTNIEYIIIDGGSTDGTIDIIRKYENRIAYWVSEPDKGIYDAMNKGILKCSGELIGIINSDDWYEPNCFQNIVTAYLSNQNSVIYGLIRSYNSNNDYFIETISPSMLDKGYTLPHPTCFVPLNVYMEYGTFDLKYPTSADVELMIRFKQQKVSFIQIDFVLANFRLGGMSAKNSSLIETLKLKREKGMISKKEFIIRYLYYKFIR